MILSNLATDSFLEENENYLINDDCFNVMKNIPDASIRLILADLPFGTTQNSWDNLLNLTELWKEYERIIAPDGNILLFGTGLFAFKLALSNEKLFRYDLIWKKSKCGSPFTAKYMPMKKHELILVFGNSAALYNPQMTKGTPYKRSWTPNKTNNMKFGIAGVKTDNKGTRHPTTILDFPQKWRRQDQKHPTQKPLELLRWLVRSYSNKGDYVLDNTMGSGGTCVSAKLEGRKYIGIEMASDYYKIALERVAEMK